ncbi:hypothetical protein ACLB2K_004566 [Fragaria x ananassa]
MGLLSNKIDRDHLRPGDHIYSWRNAYLYAHHGIYVGDGKVIHFTRAAGREIGTGTVLDRFIFSSSPSHSSENPCTSCDEPSGRDAFFIAKARGGTCTLASSDPSEDVLHRAFFLLQNGFGSYCLFKNNCEDFAIYCKTGLLVFTSLSVGRSGQAASIFSAASAIACSPARYLTTTFSGLSAFGAGIYCLHRLVCDIGIRRDVSKVPAERLVDRVGLVESAVTTDVVKQD